jgi:pantothenate kinase
VSTLVSAIPIWVVWPQERNQTVNSLIGKTTLAAKVSHALNARHAKMSPSQTNTKISSFIPMDGYHLSRAQLDELPDPSTAHARRGAPFTFDPSSFLTLVKKLREPLLPETLTHYAPSFDHAAKDPKHNDIAIAPTTRVIVFEGNYLSLDRDMWRDIAKLMDELWFVEVDFAVARERLAERHVRAGIASNEDEAKKRADENDLPNGKVIVDERLPNITEIITSKEDDGWRADAQSLGN